MPEHCVSRSRAHSQEVCGLAWSGDGRYLASGGNDNVLNIWTPDPGQCHPRPEPVFSLQEHQVSISHIILSTLTCILEGVVHDLSLSVTTMINELFNQLIS